MTNQLYKCDSRYVMEISSYKIMVNRNYSSLLADTTLNDNKLEEVNTFYYLGAILSMDGSCETDISI